VALSPRVFDTLVLMVRNHGALVPKESFMEVVWPGTFVSDVTLAHNISALRKVLGHSDDNIVIETVVKKGYRFLPPVVRRGVDRREPVPVTAGEDSTGAQGVEGDSAGDRTVSHQSLRRRALAVGVMAALVVGGLAWAMLGTAALTGRTPPIRSLVVMPFDNMSPDQADDFLAAGLTEGLTTELARVGGLRVISRGTAMQYRTAGKPLPEVAKELDVDAVVEGSFLRDGDRLRVTARLIQAIPEQHLWAESYDRAITDLITLQDDLARSVTRAIAVELSVGDRARLARRPSSQPAAYEAYLKGRYYESGAAGPAAERAIAAYERAVTLDPQFASAYAGLARQYIFGVRRRPRLALAAAKDAAATARRLDAALPDVAVASALVRLYHEHDFEGAAQEFRQAIESSPGDAEAHFYYSQALVASGRFDEALVAARRAAELDPLSPLIAHYIGRIYYFARRYGEALDALEKALELNPNYAFTHMYLVTTHERLHQYDRALHHRQRYWSLLGRPLDRVAVLGNRMSEAGYKGVLREWAGEAIQNVMKTGYVTSTELTHVLAEAGDADEAIRWFQRAVDDGTRDLIYAHVEPGFDALGGDTRFTDLLKRIRRRADDTSAAQGRPSLSSAMRPRSAGGEASR
jgi:TolB-like protein/Tfp pilus assembly protein PilF